ncbi:MAG: PD-(D/E)XK nuclease family protein, partial [Nitrospinota bacterium]|nr:PD-(D/E)XK nuclease family protein [Nitrospinota bacterium]
LVGDPMQSIYRFRDAEVGLFIQAKDKGLGHIPLKKLQLLANFRSQKYVVDWVNGCFSEILPEVDDPDRGAIAYTECSAVQGGTVEPGVALHPATDSKSNEEAHHVVDVIRDIRAHYPKDSIAILVRARPHLLNIVPLLQEAGIQFRAEEIDPLTSRPAILDLLALMRALISPLDRVSWLSILRAPWCGLSLENLYRLCRLDHKSPVWDLLNDPQRFQQLSKEGQQRASRLIHTLQPVLDSFPTINFRDLLEGCWIKLGGPACIDAYTRKDIQVFFDKVTEVLDGGEFDNLHNFEGILENLFANPSTGEGHAVQIMTIHKAKGLEFDFVLLPGLGKKQKADEKQLINWITHGDNLLFAPIPHAGEKDSEVYEFLKRLERDRGRYETRRLLYVAATRTKKQLHLFGHTQTTKDGIAPQSPSSLYHLWNFIASDWQNAYAKIKPQPSTILKPNDEAQYLRRLPLNFETPAAPPDIQTEPALDISLEEEVPFEWAGNETRCLGNVLHRLFETIVKEGLEHWDEPRADQMKHLLEAGLMAEGMSHVNLDKTVQKGLRALKNILKDEKGRKILQRYEHEEAEYALTFKDHRNFRTKIVDRTYVDENGVRWIIDYKTGERSGGNLEGFFKQEIERYRSQLESYENLIRLQGETRPIKKALYYPLHQRLIEILPE